MVKKTKTLKVSLEQFIRFNKFSANMNIDSPGIHEKTLTKLLDIADEHCFDILPEPKIETVKERIQKMRMDLNLLEQQHSVEIDQVNNQDPRIEIESIEYSIMCTVCTEKEPFTDNGKASIPDNFICSSCIDLLEEYKTSGHEETISEETRKIYGLTPFCWKCKSSNLSVTRNGNKETYKCFDCNHEWGSITAGSLSDILRGKKHGKPKEQTTHYNFDGTDLMLCGIDISKSEYEYSDIRVNDNLKVNCDECLKIIEETPM